MSLLRRLSFCFLLIVMASRVVADEPLQWVFEPGKQLRYQVLQKTDTSMDAGPAGQLATKTTQTIDMLWTIESIDDAGAARIKCGVERVQMRMDAPMGQSFELDTSSPEASEGLATLLAPAFNALVEHGFTVTMTPDGELGDIEADEELLDAIKNLPGAGGAAPGEESIKALALPVALPLPTGEIAPGAEWTRATGEVTVPMFGEMKVQGGFRYDGPREGGAAGEVLITPSVRVNAEAPEGGPVTGSVESKQSSGEIVFNRDAGRLESSTINHTMAIKLTVGENTIAGTIEQQAAVKHGAKSDPPSETPVAEETLAE